MNFGKLEFAIMALVLAALLYFQFEGGPTPTGPVLTRPATVLHSQAVESTWQAGSVDFIDGDSMRLVLPDGTMKEIRLASIDAPEWNQSFGRASSNHLRSLIDGRPVTFYQTGTDRYRRSVGFLFAFADASQSGRNVVDVNARMIDDGFAWHAVKYSDDPGLASLEASARRDGRGLWSDPAPVPPWEHRSR